MSRKRQKPPDGPITDAEVEQHITVFFERNYELLRQEGGHDLAEGHKAQALEQAQHYWRKLKAIAISVTRTEEKLALPGQVTPNGWKFVIEGVVDIVREGDEVRMYDLKTHEARDVLAQRDLYNQQLNVYAHIWKGIRGQSLDGTAIIATRLPPELREALEKGDVDGIQEAIDAWKPVVDLPFDEKDVKNTIADFARCVDAIEDGEFAPPPPEKLRKPLGMRTQPERKFAQVHCRNCDGRSSCVSYCDYVASGAGRSRGRQPLAARDKEADRELEAWIEVNLADS